MVISKNINMNNKEKALKNLFTSVQLIVDSHEDYPQLLLHIAIELNDVNIVQEVLEKYKIDINKPLSGRNQAILSSFQNIPEPLPHDLLEHNDWNSDDVPDDESDNETNDKTKSNNSFALVSNEVNSLIE